MVIEASNQGQEPVTAVLVSGGLDSAVLVAIQAETSVVQPIYIKGGLTWEEAEQSVLKNLFKTKAFESKVLSLVSLSVSFSDLYSSKHWALTGKAPAYNTPDSDVYLAGRNALLLTKTATYCSLKGITEIAIGPLAGNPFPDATPEFFSEMEKALSLGLDHPIKVNAPLASFSKPEVIRLGESLSIEWEFTLSCMNPIDTKHCGRCSKCRERLQAFQAIELQDPATYAYRPKNITTGQ